MRGISCLDEELLALKAGLCFRELVTSGYQVGLSKRR